MWGAAAAFLACFGLTYGLSAHVLRDRLRLEGRVARITAQEENRRAERFAKRLSAWAKRTGALAARVAPAGFARRVEMQVRQAGIRHPAAIRRWVAARSALLFGTPLLCSGLLLVHPSLLSFELALVALLSGVAGPGFYLGQLRKSRHLRIRRELPNLLDVLTISVDAGLGFDQALARAVRERETPLCTELRQALAEMTLGKSRREALRDAAERVPVEDFRTWLRAVIQADRLGMGLAQVMRVQAEEARRRMRQQAEERAMKAPVKIIFPLVLFIFPGLFLVILGPAMIHIISALSGVTL